MRRGRAVCSRWPVDAGAGVGGEGMTGRRLVRTLAVEAGQVRVGDELRVAGASLRVVDMATHGHTKILLLEDGNRLRFSALRTMEITRMWHDARTMAIELRALTAAAGLADD